MLSLPSPRKRLRFDPMAAMTDRENERPTRRATRSGAPTRDRWRDDDGKKRSGRARGRVLPEAYHTRRQTGADDASKRFVAGAAVAVFEVFEVFEARESTLSARVRLASPSDASSFRHHYTFQHRATRSPSFASRPAHASTVAPIDAPFPPITI